MLASQPLAVGAADHLTKILRDEFQVTPQGNSFLVQSKDFRSVGDYLGALLGRPEYACFLRPQNAGGGTGGASATQAAPTTPANPAAVQQPRNMGEAILMGMAQRSQDAAAAESDRRLDRYRGREGSASGRGGVRASADESDALDGSAEAGVTVAGSSSHPGVTLNVLRQLQHRTVTGLSS